MKTLIALVIVFLVLFIVIPLIVYELIIFLLKKYGKGNSTTTEMHYVTNEKNKKYA